MRADAMLLMPLRRAREANVAPRLIVPRVPIPQVVLVHYGQTITVNFPNTCD